MGSTHDDRAGGTQLPFVLNKALGYATRIRDRVLAQLHGVGRAGIRVLLRVGVRRERSRHHGEESQGAQFQHDGALQVG